MKDHTGKKFGRLTAIQRTRANGQVAYICLCDCGRTKTVRGTHLNPRGTMSCGCMKATRTTHGKTDSREWNSWRYAKNRCFNPNSEDFKNYGGRGITMCSEWRGSFEAFFSHIGLCPDGLTLDRIDNNKGYEPGNVRWATRKQQAINRRTTKPSTILAYEGGVR